MGRRILATLVVLGFALLTPTSAGAAAGDARADDAPEADDEAPTPDEIIARAVRWLGRQQVRDGGFDGYIAGGGTPDAILALAESAQTEAGWDNRAAVERVETETTRDDQTPLDAVRRLARRVHDPAVTSRLITRVALPLGLDLSHEGPLGDLIAPVGAWLEDEDVAFDNRVELAIGLLATGAALPDGFLDDVVAAQQADGGWNAAGDPDAETVDLKTTGAVVDLLVLTGTMPNSETLTSALSFVGTTQDRQGTWPDPEGTASATATAGAIRAIRAVGQDPAGSCWQTSVGLEAGKVTSIDGLAGLQADNGGFGGANAVPEAAEAVHALSGRWLPRGRAPMACLPEEEGLLPFAPSLLVLGALLVVGVGGGVRILRAPANL